MTMPLATAETFYPDTRHRNTRPAERAPRSRGLRPMTGETAPGIEVAVYVNHGRWIAECPFCASAQVASATDPRFLCADCGNVNVNGKWVRLAWPKPKYVDAITAALSIRPMDARNWRPGETVQALRRENAEHGIGEA